MRPRVLRLLGHRPPITQWQVLLLEGPNVFALQTPQDSDQNMDYFGVFSAVYEKRERSAVRVEDHIPPRTAQLTPCIATIGTGTATIV